MIGEAAPAAIVAGAVDAARAYLRMADGADDDVLRAAAAAAFAVAETFCGTALAARSPAEPLPQSWDALPAALAQGLVLLVAHLAEYREGDVLPPAAVAALWRPYRTMRLMPEAAA